MLEGFDSGKGEEVRGIGRTHAGTEARKGFKLPKELVAVAPETQGRLRGGILFHAGNAKISQAVLEVYREGVGKE